MGTLEKPLFSGAGAISTISDDVQQFLRKYIQSVWQLELLTYLSAASAPLSLNELAKRLYISADMIEPALDTFEKAGLVKINSGDPQTYTFFPASKELRQLTEAALKAHATQRVQVVNAIYNAPLQSFSDAFDLRKRGDS